MQPNSSSNRNNKGIHATCIRALVRVRLESQTCIAHNPTRTFMYTYVDNDAYEVTQFPWIQYSMHVHVSYPKMDAPKGI